MKESAAPANEINRAAAAPSRYPFSKGRPSLQIKWRSPFGMGRPLQSVILYEGVGRSLQLKSIEGGRSHRSSFRKGAAVNPEVTEITFRNEAAASVSYPL